VTARSLDPVSAAVVRIAGDWPPFTAETRAKLAALLTPLA
jgi:hypothetical protein